MKKTIGALAVAAFLGTTSAMAADVGGPAPYDWTGFYLGANGGFGFGNNSWNDIFGGGTNKANFSGALGGATIGANFQSGNFVFGAEVDGDWADLKAQTSGGTFDCTTTCDTYVNWLGTARLRAGVLLSDNFLLYATGGAAMGGVQLWNPPHSVDVRSSPLGWTVGGGVEAALDQHWSLKAEGLYVDLGRQSEPVACTNCFSDVNFAVARIGVNYKF